MKDIEKVSSGKVKYDSLTGKSIIDSTISQFHPHMNKILGINNENYINTLLSKKYFHLKLTNCQPQITYLMVSQVTYCILDIVSFDPKNIQHKKLVNGVVTPSNSPPPYEQLLSLPNPCFKMFLERSLNDPHQPTVKISIVLHIV